MAADCAASRVSAAMLRLRVDPSRELPPRRRQDSVSGVPAAASRTTPRETGVESEPVDDVLCVKCDQLAPPAAIAGSIVVCGACGGTLNVSDEGDVRAARLTDIQRLTAAEQQALKNARAPLVRRFQVQ